MELDPADIRTHELLLESGRPPYRELARWAGGGHSHVGHGHGCYGGH